MIGDAIEETLGPNEQRALTDGGGAEGGLVQLIGRHTLTNPAYVRPLAKLVGCDRLELPEEY